MGAFEFVVLATLRVGQLMRGCIPTIDGESHRVTVIAQGEIAAGTIARVPATAARTPDVEVV